MPPLIRAKQQAVFTGCVCRQQGHTNHHCCGRLKSRNGFITVQPFSDGRNLDFTSKGKPCFKALI
ncbi:MULTISPECIES: hypothetical protein [unclassified Neisseria]|uniref:hypothetical protein n=1 Tax=unclassified Neisseria TaxID=2623750 RepID=UPI0010720C74|nr:MULTISPECIES: hypothetical protein [unclassified Neisseria]MBF0804035.1 hypothetical protein [Neisseria sp. 19428wB4_WF04]